MTTENKNQANQDSSTSSLESVGGSRRKWLKKAGVAAPGLLLLANRPAMAASCTISGFMSAQVGTSLTNYNPGACNGWSPGNWKNDNGQITRLAWNQARIGSSDTFDSHFSTANLVSISIHKNVAGTPEATAESYSSEYSFTMLEVLNGAIAVGGGSKGITKHATASLLNASFLKYVGSMTNPEPWMLNYQAPEDIIAFYLLYEMTYLNTSTKDFDYVLMKGGSPYIDSTNVSKTDYANFFDSISDGNAQGGWDWTT